MTKLLFPVKLGPGRALLILVGVFPACGYAPVNSARHESDDLCVVAAPHRSPELHAVHALLHGARKELARVGLLRAGSGYPRVEIELLRVDERPAGILAIGETPLARGAEVGVLGRAWIAPAPAGPPERDTGDLRRSETYAQSPDPSADALRHRQAVEAAAGEVGAALARRILGLPVPAIEPM